MDNLWFTSDTHFGHANIIKYCNRPFENVWEHDKTLVSNWNSVVGLTDEIYHLGDFGFGSKGYMIQILQRLNGKIFFVKGNHDKAVKKPEPSAYFQWMKDYFELPIQGMKDHITGKIVLCHYPFRSWNKSFHGSYHLYGHCHGRLADEDKNILRHDVGVDNNNFTPVSLKQICDIMSKKNWMEHRDEKTRK
jgi:calcineurin-like phosphoesterase family protein